MNTRDNLDIKSCEPLCRNCFNLHEERLERQKEYKEFWKASALTFLSTGTTTKEHTSYSGAACDVADKMLNHFKNKFG